MSVQLEKQTRGCVFIFRAKVCKSEVDEELVRRQHQVSPFDVMPCERVTCYLGSIKVLSFLTVYTAITR